MLQYAPFKCILYTVNKQTNSGNVPAGLYMMFYFCLSRKQYVIYIFPFKAYTLIIVEGHRNLEKLTAGWKPTSA
jgi:hypothetical protein